MSEAVTLSTAAFEAVRVIEAFDRDCEFAGHTDTGDAWAIFNDVKSRLWAVLTPEQIAKLAELEKEHDAELAQMAAKDASTAS